MTARKALISGPELAALLDEFGAEVAFERFYECYYGYIKKGVTWRLNREQKCGNPESHGMVVTNRSLFAMYRWLKKQEETGTRRVVTHLKPYIRTVYSRFITRHLKRHAIYLERDVSLSSDAKIVERLGVREHGDSLASREQLDRLTEKITKLPVKQRIAIEMAAAGHNSFEIGEALRVSPATARTWLARFRRGVRPKK